MKNVIAFVHIEKTAGTSVIHMLRDSFSPVYVDVRPVTGYGYWFRSRDLNWYLRAMPWISIIGGHSIVPYSGIEDNYNVKYFTIFRDPVDRYISQYRYWRSDLNKNITFEIFMNEYNSWDMQTKRICENGKASTAINVLKSKFIAYGLVEHMDLFVGDLRRYFNKDMRIHHRNYTKKKSDRIDEIKDKYLHEIIDRNKQDIELYEWVKSVVKLRQMKHPGKIDEQVGFTRRMLLDYIYRKSFCEPTSGVKRLLNNMPYHGSYGIV